MVTPSEVETETPLTAEPTPHLSASTPDGAIYRDEAIFRTELERFYFRDWLLVGREDRLPEPGDYLTQEVGDESLILLRDAARKIRGFYNVCRHRGTRLLSEPEGSGLKSIQCPYHSWTYSLDGRLTGTAHTQHLQRFRREDYGLFPVRVETWGGFFWANLDPSATSLIHDFGRFFSKMARFPIASLKLGGRKAYEVEANWKILVENYSECYHCAPVHPNLNRLTPYLTGDNDAYYHRDGAPSKFAGGWMTFAGDYTSMTRTGYTKRPILPGMSEEDRGRVYYYTLFPNTFFSLHPDYLMIHRTWPVSPSHSRVENEFYFAPEALAAPGFDPSDAIDLWDEINRQDWHVCELAQKGSRSRIWHGGRYSDQESLVCDFDQFVQERLRGAK